MRKKDEQFRVYVKTRSSGQMIFEIWIPNDTKKVYFNLDGYVTTGLKEKEIIVLKDKATRLAERLLLLLVDGYLDDVKQMYASGMLIENIIQELEAGKNIKNVLSTRKLRNATVTEYAAYYIEKQFGLVVELNSRFELALANEKKIETYRKAVNRFLESVAINSTIKKVQLDRFLSLSQKIDWLCIEAPADTITTFIELNADRYINHNPPTGDDLRVYLNQKGIQLRQSNPDKKYGSERYNALAERTYLTFLRYCAIATKLTDLNTVVMKNYADYLGKKMKSNNYYSHFCSILDDAALKGLITTEDYRLKKVKIVYQESEVKDALNHEDIRKIYNANWGDFEQLKYAFMLSTQLGLRFSDICKLKFMHLENRELSLPKQVKTGNPVNLPLSQFAETLITEIIERFHDGIRHRNALVFQFAHSPTTFRTNMEDLIRKSGVINKYVTFHAARTTFATLLYEANVDLLVIASYLGHSDLKTVYTYLRSRHEKYRSAIEALNPLKQ